MDFNFLHLLNKPKLAMTAADDLVLGAWLLLIVALLFGAFLVICWLKEKVR